MKLGVLLHSLREPPQGRAPGMAFWAWLSGHTSSLPKGDWIEGAAFVPRTFAPSSPPAFRSTLGYILC